MANHHDRLVVQAGKAAGNGQVVAEVPVTGQLHLVGENPVDEIPAVRTVRMPGNLALLPGRKPLVGLFKLLLGLLLKIPDLFVQLWVFLPRSLGSEFR